MITAFAKRQASGIKRLCQDAQRPHHNKPAPEPLFPTPMSVESFPKFTPPAAKLWADIPAQTRKQLLSNVWCGRCKHSVTIKNFSGVVRANNLLLVGQCSECQSDVARLIESS